MPFEIGDARLLHERAEAAAQPFVWLTGPGIKEQIFRLFFSGSGNEAGNYFVSNLIQRNPAGFSTFSFCEKDGPLLKVDLIRARIVITFKSPECAIKIGIVKAGSYSVESFQFLQ